MKVKAVFAGQLYEPFESHFLIPRKQEKISADILKLPNKIRALSSKNGERDKLKTEYGVWFVTHFDKWGYGVCADSNYPERHAFGLIKKLKEFIQKNNRSASFKKEVLKFIEELIEQYSNLSKIDKVHKAQQQIDDLQVDLHTGIRKLIKNSDDIDQMSNRAQKMKNFASEFNIKSEKIEKITFWKKWKLIIFIASAILALLIAIGITIILKK